MLLYAVTKFIAYGAWCLVGLRLFAPARASVVSSLKYGSLRWLLGLFFGLVVGVALGSVSKESVTTLYFGVYIPLRIVECAAVRAEKIHVLIPVLLFSE